MTEHRQKALFFGLGEYSWLEESYDDFLRTVRSKAKVISYKNTDIQATIETLKAGTVSAVVLFEPSLIEKKDKLLTDALIEFTKAGGTTIFAGLCSSFCGPPNLNAFFSKWNLPWKSGTYLRTTFTANSHARLDLTTKIPSSYSMKALHLKNVATEDLVYVTTSDSQLESLVFTSQPVRLTGEGPIVFAQYHDGRISWIGDVNHEEGTKLVLLAMLGL